VTLQLAHRPTIFDEIMGNESAVESLRSVLTRETDIPHVYLFTGQVGGGKTSLAFIIKEMLGCSESDFYYYNAASTRGIQTIRDIIDSCQFMPMNGKIKFFLMEEAHGITGDALNALLKFMEFPPNHIYMAFCTSEIEKMGTPAQRAAFKRRCHHTELKPLSLPEINKLLKTILEKENVSEFPNAVLEKIADVCKGSPGQALNFLDTVIDIADDDTALKAIEDATVGEANIAEIARILLSGRGQWSNIAKLIKGLTGEPESLRYAFLGYFNAVLLGGKNSDKVAAMMMPFTDTIMYTGKGGLTLAIYFAFREST
jgi:DNA polymerase III subunit gamma/tau